jgi:hypothetical protein
VHGAGFRVLTERKKIPGAQAEQFRPSYFKPSTPKFKPSKPKRASGTNDAVVRLPEVHFRARREQLKRSKGLSPKSHGQNLALNILYVPQTPTPANPSAHAEHEAPSRVFQRCCGSICCGSICCHIFPSQHIVPHSLNSILNPVEMALSMLWRGSTCGVRCVL